MQTRPCFGPQSNIPCNSSCLHFVESKDDDGVCGNCSHLRDKHPFAEPDDERLNHKVWAKVRSAAARVFIQTVTMEQPLQRGCGGLISPEFVVTASHLIPRRREDLKGIWIQLGCETQLRAATVHTCMSVEKENVMLLQLTEVVRNVQPLGFSLTVPSRQLLMAIVGSHQRHPMNDNHGPLASDRELPQAQIEMFTHASFALPGSTGTAIGWYSCCSGLDGSVVVHAHTGEVVGVHTSMLINNYKAQFDIAAASYCESTIGRFQTLAHEPVLMTLRTAKIVTGAESSKLAAYNEFDDELYNPYPYSEDESVEEEDEVKEDGDGDEEKEDDTADTS